LCHPSGRLNSATIEGCPRRAELLPRATSEAAADKKRPRLRGVVGRLLVWRSVFSLLSGDRAVSDQAPELGRIRTVVVCSRWRSRFVAARAAVVWDRATRMPAAAGRRPMRQVVADRVHNCDAAHIGGARRSAGRGRRRTRGSEPSPGWDVGCQNIRRIAAEFRHARGGYLAHKSLRLNQNPGSEGV